MVLNELAAVVAERAEIEADGIDDGRAFAIGERDVLVEVQRPEVPVLLLEKGLAEVGVAEREHALPRRRNEVAARGILDPRRIAGVDLLAGPRILRPVVDLFQRGNLGSGEAVGSVCAFAGKHGGIEVAEAWIGD